MIATDRQVKVRQRSVRVSSSQTDARYDLGRVTPAVQAHRQSAILGGPIGVRICHCRDYILLGHFELISNRERATVSATQSSL